MRLIRTLPTLGAASAVLAILAAALRPASGQIYSADYALSWSTLDGGGGQSAGGAFTLDGTIGQPDAGAPITGGGFTLTGGFWGGSTGVTAEPIPWLSIRLAGPLGDVNTVILFWPNPSNGYVLQQSADMSAPGGGWTDVTRAPVIVGPNKEVTLLATGSVCFFRLRHP